MGTVILIGFLGAVISSITGMVWYSRSTPMGKWHMQYLGFDKLSEEEKQQKMKEGKSKMMKNISIQVVMSLITSLFIGFVTYYTVNNGGEANAVYYYVLMIWFAFTVPIIGQSLLWGSCEKSLAIKRFFSDSMYNLITFLIIALVATILI